MTARVAQRRGLLGAAFALVATCAAWRPGLVHAACAHGAADTVRTLVERFANQSLTPASARLVLGEGAQARLLGRYWQVQAPDCALEIVFPAEADGGAPLAEAELRLQPGATLRLHELQALLGEAGTVHIGKTSSVRFRALPRPGAASAAAMEPVLVFAALRSHRPVPDAPVQRVVLRREQAAAPR